MRFHFSLVLLSVLSGCVFPSLGAHLTGAAVLSCPQPCGTRVDGGEGLPRETSLAVDPGDARHLVAVAVVLPPNGGSTVGAAVPYGALISYASLDGGATWRGSRLPLPAGVNALGSDPCVVIFPDHAALLVALATPSPGAGGTDRTLYAWRSIDAGATWDLPMTIDAGAGILGGPGHDSDGPWLARGADGVALLSWGRYDTGPDGSLTITITAAHTSDEGRTWSLPVQIASGPHVDDAGPIFLPDGRALVSFVDATNATRNEFGRVVHFESDVRFAMSSDDARTWDVRTLAEHTSSFWPRLARAGDRVLIEYTRADAASGDIVVVRGSSDGATWTPEIRIADHAHAGRPAPDLAAAGHTAWIGGYDDRKAYRVVAIRDDVASAPLLVDPGPTDVGTFATYGEYMGLAAIDDAHAQVAWTTGTGDATRLMTARLSAS